MSKCFHNCEKSKKIFDPLFLNGIDVLASLIDSKKGVFTFLQMKNLLHSFKDLFETSGHNRNGTILILEKTKYVD